MAKVIKIVNVKLSNKQIGYLSLTFIALSLLAGALALYSKSSHSHHRIQVIFEEIGSLKPEVLVLSQGVAIGQVTEVKRVDGKSVVVLDFYEPLQVLEGTKIYNRNFSLVGERYVIIEFAKKGRPILANEYIEGEYERGFSESLHLMQMAIDEVALVQQLFAPQLTSTDSSTAFYIQFRDLLVEIETMVNKVDQLVQTTAPLIENTLKQGDELTKATIEVSNDIDSQLNQLAQNSVPLINSIQSTLVSLTETFSALDKQLQQTTSNELYKDHLEGKELLEDIKKGLATTEMALLAIKTGGSSLSDSNGIPKLGFKNFYFFRETARSKRKRQSEEKK